MIPMEELLRQTFAERERDVDDVPLLVPPHRPRRAGVVLAGAAAAAAVLVGTAVALTAHRPDPAGAGALRYAPAPIVSAGNRTSAFLTWAPTWTPAAESGREITSTMQTRYYGWEGAGPFAAVTVGRGDCRSLQQPSGYALALRRDGFGTSWYVLCRPLPGGGALDVRILGAGEDPAVATGRIAASIRTGRRDEVALPVSLPAGTEIRRLSVGSLSQARSRWTGDITTADGTNVYLGPPQGPLQPNRTIGGRPAHVGEAGTLVQLDLAPTVRTMVDGRDHDRAAAAAAALHLGPMPDYSWLG